MALPRSATQLFSIQGLLSKDSLYGLVYRATVHPQDTDARVAVLKKVLLDTGLHYDNRRHAHLLDGKSIDLNVAKRLFQRSAHDGERFLTGRSMSPEYFLNEVQQTQRLFLMGLAPELYDFWTEQKAGVRYGLLLMARCDTTAKQLLLERDLTLEEKRKIVETFDALHARYFRHRDLKPANLGVMLDQKGRIKRCLFIDCAKTRKEKPGSKFAAGVAHDLRNYRKHVQENIQTRP